VVWCARHSSLSSLCSLDGSTMERYEKEVRTGHLNWGLLHTDKFWKENFMAFENKEFELIRCVETVAA
jgi:hypothetical protein